MQTKLTLRLEDSLIEKAKQYSQSSGSSLSKLVAEFFASLPSQESQNPIFKPSARVLKLYGSIAGSRLDEKDYRDHLERKHR